MSVTRNIESQRWDFSLLLHPLNCNSVNFSKAVKIPALITRLPT
jgi:hypothetical protein